MAELSGHLRVSTRCQLGLLNPTSTINLHITASSLLAAASDVTSSHVICNKVVYDVYVSVCDVKQTAADNVAGYRSYDLTTFYKSIIIFIIFLLLLCCCCSTKRCNLIIKLLSELLMIIIALNLFYRKMYINVCITDQIRVRRNNRIPRYKSK